MRLARALALCVALGLAWTSPVPARADGAPKTGPQMMMQQASKSYQHYATGLGCSELVYSNVAFDGTNTIYTFKYLPKGVAADKWTKMVIITVYGMSGNRALDTDAIARNINKIESQYKKAAAVSEDQNYMSMQQELMMFMQYSFNSASDMIYGAAVYLRTSITPSSAAFIQLQSRAGPLTPQEALNVHHLVNMTAKLPDAPVAPGAPDTTGATPAAIPTPAPAAPKAP